MREEDFVKYYDMYERIVYRVSLHYTKDTYAAEDITQKVFCELLSRFDTINPDCVKAYLTRAASQCTNINLEFVFLCQTISQLVIQAMNSFDNQNILSS